MLVQSTDGRRFARLKDRNNASLINGYTNSSQGDTRKVFLLLVFVSVILVIPGRAQETNVFGYFQAMAEINKSEDPSIKSFNTFNLSQLNLLLSHDLSSNFSAFVNFELVNSYSTEHNWGQFSLQEAWLRYVHSNELQAKAGLLIPTFNNLNEIKNRTPLLPYIIRPIVYEAILSGIVSPESFLPERAFVQVNGTFPLSGALLDYAAYIGNGESKYHATSSGQSISTSGLFVSGSDSTTFKMVGGRIGVRVADLKVGISATYDRNNQNTPLLILPAAFPALPVLGDVIRYRLGADLSYHIDRWTLEGEVISVKHSLSDIQQNTLNSIVATLNSYTPLTHMKSPVGNSMDKLFYYGNVMYDFTDQWYGYAGYSYIDDKLQTYGTDGLTSLTIGGGFRPNDHVVIKGQWVNFKLKNEDFIKVNLATYFLAVSIFF